MWNWQNPTIIILPLCSSSCLSGSPGWEMYSPWDKVQKQHQVDPLASALCTHFCNYILLLWKPRTFGSSSAQPLSHQPFWSQLWLLERKAQLDISYFYSILGVTTTWQTPHFWRVPETRFLKFYRWGGRICCCTWTNLRLSTAALIDFPLKI